MRVKKENVPIFSSTVFLQPMRKLVLSCQGPPDITSTISFLYRVSTPSFCSLGIHNESWSLWLYKGNMSSVVLRCSELVVKMNSCKDLSQFPLNFDLTSCFNLNRIAYFYTTGASQTLIVRPFFRWLICMIFYVSLLEAYWHQQAFMWTYLWASACVSLPQKWIVLI